jgi:hypothetical protein
MQVSPNGDVKPQKSHLRDRFRSDHLSRLAAEGELPSMSKVFFFHLIRHRLCCDYFLKVTPMLME